MSSAVAVPLSQPTGLRIQSKTTAPIRTMQTTLSMVSFHQPRSPCEGPSRGCRRVAISTPSPRRIHQAFKNPVAIPAVASFAGAAGDIKIDDDALRRRVDCEGCAGVR